ncbi:helix-turn-helix domain-containing protein [Pedobacter sp. L105]|uniref:helix-turn-helix domain-containing protein n=1 Tax=Pedobacter sp. L105 TaxID=1641871 RepID=UPI00131C3D7A|nr:helix-turn-helix transcriptional regulator [Pedobacter sp. L105]
MEDIELFVINAISKFRREKQLSQKELGIILHVSASFIGNVENGNNAAKYNLKHIALLAAHFKLSPRFFMPL